MDEFLGPVKTKRDDLFLKLVKKISKPDYTMHFMEDRYGRKAMFYNYKGVEIKKDECCILKATIAEHRRSKFDNGKPLTYLNRVTVRRNLGTKEDPKWTEKYHDPNPNNKCFGGKVIIMMKGGSTISEEINVADAHPAGKRPFTRKEYINKFKTLTDGIVSKKESDRFLKCVQNLPKLKAKDLIGLNVEVKTSIKDKSKSSKGIF